MTDTRQYRAVLLLFVVSQVTISEGGERDDYPVWKETGSAKFPGLDMKDGLLLTDTGSRESRVPLLKLIKQRRKLKSSSAVESASLLDTQYPYSPAPEPSQRNKAGFPLKKNIFKFKSKPKKDPPGPSTPTIFTAPATTESSTTPEGIFQFPSFQDAKALSQRYDGPGPDESQSEDFGLADFSRVRSSKPKKALKVVRRKKLRDGPKSRTVQDQQYKKRAPVTHTLYLDVPDYDYDRSGDRSERPATKRAETPQQQDGRDTLLYNSPIYSFSEALSTSEAPVSPLSHSSYLNPHIHNSGAAVSHEQPRSRQGDLFNSAYRYPTSSERSPPKDRTSLYPTMSAPQSETPYDYPESSSAYPQVTSYPEPSKQSPWEQESRSQGKQPTPKSKQRKKISKYDSRSESHYSSGSEHKSSVIYTPKFAEYPPRDHFSDKYRSSGQWDDRFNTLEEEEFSSVPGIAGRDYPTYDAMPKTKFSCAGKGPGYYADIDSGCQMFHVCDLTIHSTSFLCPNGTLFNDNLHVCDWWNNVKCGVQAREPPMGHHTYESHLKDYDDRVIFPYLEKDHLPEEPFDNSLNFY